MVHSLFIRVAVVFPDQQMLERPAKAECSVLYRSKWTLFRRCFLFKPADPGKVEKEENSKKVENDIPVKISGEWLICLRGEDAKVPPALRPIHVQCGKISVSFCKPTVFTITGSIRIKQLSNVLGASEKRT